MIFAISVLELVRIAMLPKIRQKCPWVSQLLSCVPDYKSYNIHRVFLVYSCIRYVHIKVFNLSILSPHNPNPSAIFLSFAVMSKITWLPIRSITRVEYHQLTWCRWLPHRLSKRQSLTATVLFRTTFTQTILLNLLISVQPNEPRPPRQKNDTNFEISQSQVEI